MNYRKTLISIFIIFIIWYSFLSVNVWDKSFTKYKILNYIPDCHPNKLNQSLFKKSHSTKLLYNLKLPKVFKSNDCSHFNSNVFLIESKRDLDNFLNKFNRNKFNFIIQEPCFEQNEFTVCFTKNPITGKNHVFHLTKRYEVNKDTNKLTECGKFCISERPHEIIKTKLPNKFKRRIIELCSYVPNLKSTRFDIKAKDLKSLLNNEFKVIEMNGVLCMFFLGSIVNNKITYFRILLEVIRIFFGYILKLILGLMNIITLKAHNPIKILGIMSDSTKTINKCGIKHVLSPSPV